MVLRAFLLCDVLPSFTQEAIQSNSTAAKQRLFIDSSKIFISSGLASENMILKVCGAKIWFFISLGNEHIDF